MLKCHTNFQSQYANIEKVGHINVEDFITNGYTTHSHKPRCIQHNHELVLVNGTQKKPHFRHKHSSDLEGAPMTEWHAEWQGNFIYIEKIFKNRSGQIKDRRADILISDFNRIVEIQHSVIDRSEVKNRNDDYGLHGHEVVWIIDSQKSILVKKIGERIVLHFEINSWLYERFLDCEHVYYDIDGFIYKVNPNLIKANQVDVCEPKIKADCIEALKTKPIFWENEEPPQSFLYVKQQGAGSGKTYGMMQLLNADPEITNFKWILFITKQHAAVNVMYTEFMNQYTEGKLPNIEMLEEPRRTEDEKKYIVHYKHKLTNVEVYVVFATVDSFTWAVGEKSAKSSDTFASIVQSIKDGVSKIKHSGKLVFAGVDPFINKETIVMIDETQDLTELYGEAFLKFVSSNHTSVCIVGDRLQSLAYRKNALTFLHNADAAGLKVVKEDASNVVRRFSNPRLIKFVNSMIPFEKYDLPPMTPAIIEEETPGALTVFSAQTIYANQSKEDEKTIVAVKQIMDYFKTEAISMNRIPEDFLIVTPFTSKNPLVESLQIAINMFWKKTMESNSSYIENVKLKHPFWKDMNPNHYTRYAVFHKSQEMGSINLSESDHATRIVSIHSSKGDGRKVVFVVGVNQSSLQIFSQVSNNLIYDSLLHVAITRQKERLYFRLEQNEDDIHARISKSVHDIIIQSEDDFEYEHSSIRFKRITNNLLKFSFDEIYENIICKNEPPKLPPESDKKLLIDMGDHNIRYASMFMNVIVHICNHEQKTKSGTKRQLFAILKKIQPQNIKPVSELKDYINMLETNNPKDYNSKEKTQNIPVLHFKTRDSDRDYNKYFNFIIETMNRVIKELELLGKGQLHYFCPLESIILYFMIECIEQGKYQAITINDVYNIIDIYSKIFDPLSKGHEYCKCNSHFKNSISNLNKKQLEHQEYLYNHYERLTHISSLLDSFIAEHQSVNWLYRHGIKCSGSENDDFRMTTGFDLLGYDNNHTYIFNILPQFNELNFNEITVNSIYNTWLIHNINNQSEKYEKFNGKPIISCVLSLNRTELYTMDWTYTVINNRDFIVNSLYKAITNKISTKHEQYYNIFMRIIQETTGNIKETLHKCQKSITHNTAPYISKFWNTLEGNIGECSNIKEKREMLAKYMDKESFVTKIDGYLDRSLMGFLGMIEEEENEMIL